MFNFNVYYVRSNYIIYNIFVNLCQIKINEFDIYTAVGFWSLTPLATIFQLYRYNGRYFK